MCRNCTYRNYNFTCEIIIAIKWPREKFFAQCYQLSTPVESSMDVLKTLAVVINIDSNCLQQNGKLIFDNSLETGYDNISLKASEHPEIRSLN